MKKCASIKKTGITSLFLGVALAWTTGSNAQNFSSGSLEFIFKPSNNGIQFAVWVEDDSGAYKSTVFLTDFIGRRGGANRSASPDIDLGDGNRLSALPVWAYKRGVIDMTYGIANYYPPASTQPSYPDDIDAVSVATPGPSLQKKIWHVSDLPSGKYTCWIQANHSFDFNAYHNYSWYRGQPSVVWSVPIQVADVPDTNTILDYIGYGSPDGSDGSIHAPDSTITTEANLLADLGGYRFKVIYTPEATNVSDDFSSSVKDFSILEQN
jgi:hypothetical protein